uniref:Uncharacterized protein n=1 Tax=viral metagenome TaxID=1070528 RepID=A0A6M3XVZ4_9ZZZZ
MERGNYEIYQMDFYLADDLRYLHRDRTMDCRCILSYFCRVGNSDCNIEKASKVTVEVSPYKPLTNHLFCGICKTDARKGVHTMSRIQELKQELHALPGDRREEIDKLLRELIEEMVAAARGMLICL